MSPALAAAIDAAKDLAWRPTSNLPLASRLDSSVSRRPRPHRVHRIANAAATWWMESGDKGLLAGDTASDDGAVYTPATGGLP
jgi:hypothetical protein